jgi:hypothetical protein
VAVPEAIPLIYVLAGSVVALLLLFSTLIVLVAIFIFTIFPPDANDIPIEGEKRKKDNDNDRSPPKNAKSKGRGRV